MANFVWRNSPEQSLALAIWLILLRFPKQIQMGMAGVVLCTYVIALRLEPFQFQATGHAFNWIPFLGFMQGSLTVDTLSFLEKFFLYGTTLYLLGSAFGRRLPVAIVLAALLFVTSWTETWLPGSSAEVTEFAYGADHRTDLCPYAARVRSGLASKSAEPATSDRRRYERCAVAARG